MINVEFPVYIFWFFWYEITMVSGLTFLKGVFVMDKTGHKIFVFENAMVITYNRELRLI